MAVSSAYLASVAALEALEGQGMKLGLERTEALLDALGRPQDGLRGVLVAGTNGKGSVCALVDSMARAAGLRTVLLTKPHLLTWRERIVVDGEAVSGPHFAELVDDALSAAATVTAAQGRPTLFEVITAAGVLAAARADPDLLICEVGLGGRLDSTNVLDLGVAVVTNIALDHRQQLGDDLRGIAAEKAAIIKAGNDVVTRAAEPALTVIVEAAQRARARSCTNVAPMVSAGSAGGAAGVAVTFDGIELRAPLLGDFQVDNLAVAAGVARALSRRGLLIDEAAMVAGAGAVRWPGRMQWIEGAPPLLVDGCHNPAAVAAMVRGAAPLCAGRRTVVVFGAMADKDLDDMLSALRPLPDAVVFAAPSGGRAADPAALAERWRAAGGTDEVEVEARVDAALTRARELAGATGVVVACGSLYVAGETLAALAAEGVDTGLSAA